MVQLDKVYEAFANLDDDYKRSRKTRTKFIQDKFGGDINSGSMIILDYFAAEKLDDVDDIRKFTFIRNIFDKIVRLQDNLDSLSNFKFEGGSLETVNAVIDESANEVGDLVVKTQRDLYDSKKAWHYYGDVRKFYYTPLASCTMFKAYGESMSRFLRARFNPKGVAGKEGTLSTLRGYELSRISIKNAVRELRGEG